MKRVQKNLYRCLAAFLVFLMVMSGSGIQVLAQGLSTDTDVITEELSITDSEESAETVATEEVDSYEENLEEKEEDCSEECSEAGEEGSFICEEETIVTEDAEVLYSGDWGDSTHWSLDANGLLTITQDADVEYEYFSEYSDEDNEPWLDYKDDIKHMHIDATCLINYSYDIRMHEIEFYYTQDGEIYPLYENLETITFGDQFDSSYITDMSNMFYKCVNVTSIETEKLDTSNVTYMDKMFADCHKLSALDLSNFDTSKVTSFYYTFENCYSLTELDFSNFETGELYSVTGMFKNCTSLTKVDVSSFHFSSEEKSNSMYEVFYNCSQLEELDLSSFDTTGIIFFDDMFYNCTNLKSIDLSSWDMSKASISYSSGSLGLETCYRLNKIETPINLSSNYCEINNNKWKYEDGTELEADYIDYYLPTGLTESVTLTGVPVYKLTFDSQGGYEKEPQYVLEGTGTAITGAWKGDQLFWGWYTKPNGEGEEYTNMTNVQSDMTLYAYWQGDETDIVQACYVQDNGYQEEGDGIYWRIDKDYNLYAKGNGGFAAGNNLATSAPWYEYQGQIVTATISLRNIEDASYLLYGCTELKEATLFDWECSRLTTISAMFRKCTNLEKVDLSGIDISNVQSMSSLFDSCSNLTEVDISGWNTGNVLYMSNMFYECEKLRTIKGTLDISSLVNASTMFWNCYELEAVSFTGQQTGELKYANNMFWNCHKLKAIDLSGFDVSNVNELGMFFCNCNSITSLDLSNFDLSNITSNDIYMLYGCDSLVTIEAPINLIRNDVSLYSPEDEGWVRTDTNEYITTLPTGLTESITLERKVGVKPVDVTGISLYKTALSMGVDQTYQLVATLAPEKATNKSVSWSTSNPDVATVDTNGLITAKGVGTATITAKALGGDNISTTCIVTVEGMAPTLDVIFDKPVNGDGEYVLFLNDSISSNLVWKDGTAWPSVTYNVSNDTAEIVDGKLIAKKVGSGILTVTAQNGIGDGPSVSIEYHIYAEQVSNVTLNETKVILDAQSEQNSVILEANVSNSDASYADVAFSANKNNIVKIEDLGNNTARITLLDASTGNVEITATALDGSGKSAKCTIVSGTVADSITVSCTLDTSREGAYVLNTGKTVKLTAGILPAGVSVKTVTWSSSNEVIATVDEKGVVTAHYPGPVTITATATDGSQVSGSADIYVANRIAEILLEVDDAEDGKVALYEPWEGAYFTVNYRILGEDGTPINVLEEVDYSISGSAAKDVVYLGGGQFKATKAGTVTITATAKDGSKTKGSVKLTIEQHVYDFSVEKPKGMGSYEAEDGIHWIVPVGSKDVSVNPIVTYNGNNKAYQPNKDYKMYDIMQSELALNKKRTGIVVPAGTPAGKYEVMFTHYEASEWPTVWIDVVPAEGANIETVDIQLPATIKAQGEEQSLAVGSKVKLSGVLNNGVSVKGYTLKWEVSGSEENGGTATVNSNGVLDLSKASVGDKYEVILTISKGEEFKQDTLNVTVTQRVDTEAIKVILVDDPETELPVSMDVLYENSGRAFKVAEQSGTANLYSITGGKAGVLSVWESEDGFYFFVDGVGNTKITITALDGSNLKKTVNIKVVNTANPVSKITTGSKSYSVEQGHPIRIPYTLVSKYGGSPTDTRMMWQVSSENLLKVASYYEEGAYAITMTNDESGYLTLIPATNMKGKVTITGTALDGSKKKVKITVNVVSAGKKAVAYDISLRTPAKTPNGGVPGLALLTYGKSIKLQTNLTPNKSTNKTVNYKIEGITDSGIVVLTEEELKARGITVNKGTVKAAKDCEFIGYIRVTATMDYLDYEEGEISDSKVLFVQPAVSKVEITDESGTVITTATAARGSSIDLQDKLTANGELFYSNVAWSVSDAKIASVDSNGTVTIKSTAASGKKVKVTATSLDGSKKKAVVTITVK